MSYAWSSSLLWIKFRHRVAGDLLPVLGVAVARDLPCSLPQWRAQLSVDISKWREVDWNRPRGLQAAMP